MIQRRTLTEKERDGLRMVAIHEAGHATVGAHFGVTGDIRISPLTYRGDPGFQFTGCHLSKAPPPDDHARCLYGLAGVAAQAIDGGWESVAPVMIRSMMSRADMELAGDFTDREVLEAVGLLRWLWPEVTVRADAAMRPWLHGPLVSEVDEAINLLAVGEPIAADL